MTLDIEKLKQAVILPLVYRKLKVDARKTSGSKTHDPSWFHAYCKEHIGKYDTGYTDEILRAELDQMFFHAICGNSSLPDIAASLRIPYAKLWVVCEHLGLNEEYKETGITLDL